MFLQLSDAELDRVALFVVFGIERGRATPGRAFLAAVGSLVRLDRDRGFDPAPAPECLRGSMFGVDQFRFGVDALAWAVAVVAGR
ncbi:hypothetical protein ACIBG0_40765 [Nocardia sp. NPDC050630]|uniref:hypothetical protein n=1 Tax=Nocardia sp. NPDC050630 TaxID=3364321 RepID=UPI00378F622F